MEQPPQNKDGQTGELLKVLVENKVISQAQATLVEADHAATEMAIEDILMARGWVKEDQLATFAPWLSGTQTGQSASNDAKSSRTFEENLKKYRSLLAEMLGESSE